MNPEFLCRNQEYIEIENPHPNPYTPNNNHTQSNTNNNGGTANKIFNSNSIKSDKSRSMSDADSQYDSFHSPLRSPLRSPRSDDPIFKSPSDSNPNPNSNSNSNSNSKAIVAVDKYFSPLRSSKKLSSDNLSLPPTPPAAGRGKDVFRPPPPSPPMMVFNRVEEKSNLPVFKHIIDSREISSTSSAQILVSDEKNFKISLNQLSTTPSAAATCIGHCADIFIEILLRLPPKSVLRFQCVSKQWRLVISNSDFRPLYCRKFHTGCLSPESDAVLLFRREKSELNFISFSGENIKAMDSITTRLSSFLSGKIFRLHSSNGLLCIDFFSNRDHREFIVYNPTTNCYRHIPKCKFAEERYTFPSAINICFDPLKSDHYKLVSIWMNEKENANYFPIYSSESGNWKDTEVSMVITPSRLFQADEGIFWNGNINWLSASSSVMYFDLNKESLNWSVPYLPLLVQGTSNYWYFGETGGCLCAIVRSPTELMLFHVLSMEKDYSGWFLKVSVDLSALTISYPSMYASNYLPQFYITQFFWCNNEKKAKLVISMAGKVILYNVSSDKNVTELVDIESVNPCWGWHSVLYGNDSKAKLVALMARKLIIYDICDKNVTEFVDTQLVNLWYRWRALSNWDKTITFTATLACV